MFDLMQVDEDERRLLERFRAMGPSRRRRVLGYAAAQAALTRAGEADAMGAGCNRVAIDGSGAYAAAGDCPARGGDGEAAGAAPSDKN